MDHYAKIDDLEKRVANLEKAFIKAASDFVGLSAVTYGSVTRFAEFVKMFETMVAAAQKPNVPKEKMN